MSREYILHIEISTHIVTRFISKIPNSFTLPTLVASAASGHDFIDAQA